MDSSVVVSDLEHLEVFAWLGSVKGVRLVPVGPFSRCLHTPAVSHLGPSLRVCSFTGFVYTKFPALDMLAPSRSDVNLAPPRWLG